MNLDTCGDGSLGHSGTLTCADDSGEVEWDVFTLAVQEGDCVHVRADNGVGAADLLAYAVDASGTFFGNAADFTELEDEWACTTVPWDGFACPDRSIVAESTGDMQIGVAQWRGGCATDAQYTLWLAINGTNVDVSSLPMTDNTASFPPN